MAEHMKTGSVDKIDFDALPLGKGDGVLHGGAARHFFFVICGGSGTVVNTALCGSHFRGMQQSSNQGGFAAVRMPHYSYVADLTSLVRFHFCSPPPAVRPTAFGLFGCGLKGLNIVASAPVDGALRWAGETARQFEERHKERSAWEIV
jgi:hypothetical protein